MALTMMMMMMTTKVRPGLKTRVRVPELMDDPGLDPREHARALAGLRRINALSRSDAILRPPLRDRPDARILIRPRVATGSGDVPPLAARFRKAGPRPNCPAAM